MILSGHVLIGIDGAIHNADSGFADLLRADRPSLLGRRILDVTAPADRDECCLALDGLRATRRPFNIVKRFVRDDASLIWVRNSVSIMGDGKTDLIVATCAAIPEGLSRRGPADLLDTARDMMAMSQERASVCNPQLVAAPGWSALLEAYIAEAEGRATSVPALAERLGHSENLVGRWIAALVSHDVLEVETRDPKPDAAKAFRLTSSAVRRLEQYLAKFGRRSPQH
jgi:hypothetical protein